MESKYYWLKLKRDFFKRHDIKIIENMPNGKDYILFYLKLLVESIDHEGQLRFSDTIPYNEEMLSVITDTNLDIVKAAVKLFTELGLMVMYDDGTIFMNEVQTMIGSGEKSTDRVIKFREKQKLIAERKIPHMENHINNKRYGGNYYKVLERDGYQCVNCGDTNKIMIHHIIPFDIEDDDTLRMENLITLCSKCHTSLHNKNTDKHIGILPDQRILDEVGFNETLMKRYRNIAKRDIEIEKELDIEKDKELESDIKTSTAPEKNYVQQVYDYCKEIGLTEDDAQAFMGYRYELQLCDQDSLDWKDDFVKWQKED